MIGVVSPRAERALGALGYRALAARYQHGGLHCLPIVKALVDLSDFVELLPSVRLRADEEVAPTQAAIDDAVLETLRRRAAACGFTGIRTVGAREPAQVFQDSIRRGELQYDHFFRGQVYENCGATGDSVHGHFPHVLQWLYYAWCAGPSVVALYRALPDVPGHDLFRRLADTLNSTVQLVLDPEPNFKAIAVNYAGHGRTVADPGSVTRLFERIFYPAGITREPTTLVCARPTREEIDALYRPDSGDEYAPRDAPSDRRRWHRWAPLPRRGDRRGAARARA